MQTTMTKGDVIKFLTADDPMLKRLVVEFQPDGKGTVKSFLIDHFKVDYNLPGGVKIQ